MEKASGLIRSLNNLHPAKTPSSCTGSCRNGDTLLQYDWSKGGVFIHYNPTA
uniref:Uncharacterized protein n=1 Tax=Anguilla anguilla TaxID=7936 RepID=A0A0E9RYS7_ANGAN